MGWLHNSNSRLKYKLEFHSWPIVDLYSDSKLLPWVFEEVGSALFGRWEWDSHGYRPPIRGLITTGWSSLPKVILRTMTQPCRRGMEGLPTFRHGNQLIVLPSIPIDHPYRHSLKSCEVPSKVWNDVQEITTPKLPHGNRQPYFEVWKWCHGSRLPNFLSKNGVMEVANPILTIKIGIMEVVIQRVRGHGSRDRKFITQKKVLEIANPIFDIKMRFWKSPSLFLPPWTRFWKSPSKFSLLNWPTWR